jgi:hypothetical protein
MALTSAILLAAPLIPGARGATITAPIILGGGTGTVTGTVSTPNPNNGHITGISSNTLDLTEDISSFWFAADFQLPNSTDSTEYFVTKTVTNHTGSAWSDFRIYVGCGQFEDDPNCPFFPLTLDYDVAPTLSVAGLLSAQSDISMTWSGLSVADGQTIKLEFSMHTCPNCGGDWGIFQNATLQPNGTESPEPGAALLVPAGLILVGSSRMLRRRRA